MADLNDIETRLEGDGSGPSPSFERPASREPEEKMSLGRWLGEFVLLVGLAWVLAFGIKTYVVQPFIIPSSSMEPTLLISDRVLVNKFIYRFRQPQQGDIVVFMSPQEGGLDLIKRVIAVGGQTVDVHDGKVSVDGKQLVEPYVNAAYPDHYSAERPIKVPASTIWVMGDNRANSKDSRYIGPQKVSNVLGEAFAIYWPLGRLRWF